MYRIKSFLAIMPVTNVLNELINKNIMEINVLINIF